MQPVASGTWCSAPQQLSQRARMVASPAGPLVLGSILYAKLLAIPLVVSYHTHIPEYIPLYFPRLVASTFSSIMWSIIRFCARAADLTLVTSKVMRVWPLHRLTVFLDMLMTHRYRLSRLHVSIHSASRPCHTSVTLHE